MKTQPLTKEEADFLNKSLIHLLGKFSEMNCDQRWTVLIHLVGEICYVYDNPYIAVEELSEAINTVFKEDFDGIIERRKNE